MRLRDKILFGWLVLAGLASLIGNWNGGLISVFLGVSANVIGWLVVFKILYWVLDLVSNNKK
jgi:hypothetical protein